MLATPSQEGGYFGTSVALLVGIQRHEIQRKGKSDEGQDEHQSRQRNVGHIERLIARGGKVSDD